MMEEYKITPERAMEILNPGHREHYDELPDGMEQVNEACRMGMDAIRKRTPTPVIRGRFGYLSCPACGWIVQSKTWENNYPPYCERCGQALGYKE